MNEDAFPSNIDLGALLREVAKIRRSILYGKHSSKSPEWLTNRLFADLDHAVRGGKLPPAHSRLDLVEELTDELMRVENIADRDRTVVDETARPPKLAARSLTAW
jgi:hypothetical protein